jgi:hypothetical protein
MNVKGMRIVENLFGVDRNSRNDEKNEKNYMKKDKIYNKNKNNLFIHIVTGL